MNLSIASFYGYYTISFVELFLVSFFISWYLPKRKLFYVRSLSSLVFFYFLSFFLSGISFPVKDWNIFTVFLLLQIMLILCLWFSFKFNFKSSVFIGITGYTLRHMIYLLARLAFVTFFSDATGAAWYAAEYIGGLVSTVIYSPLLIYIMLQLKKKPNIELLPSLLVIVGVISWLVNIVFNYYSLSIVNYVEGPAKYMMNITNTAVSALTLVLMFGYIKLRDMGKEITTLNQMRAMEAQQYAESKENIEMINFKCHNLRHQIRELANGEKVVSKDELTSIENAIRIYDTKINTNNSSLDVVLRKKSLVALKNNIALHFIADGSLLNFISETDLYSLFGNIIDNAIESVMKFENKDDRVISLKVIKRNGGVFIMEENPFKGKLVFQNGLPVTTKDNESGFHGYGSKSIQTIVESYGGILKISDENQCFSLFAFFPGK